MKSGRLMPTSIEIDDALLAEAQKASGHATKKQTVEEALRLMIRLRRQKEVASAFGKYRWRGNPGRPRFRRLKSRPIRCVQPAKPDNRHFRD